MTEQSTLQRLDTDHLQTSTVAADGISLNADECGSQNVYTRTSLWMTSQHRN